MYWVAIWASLHHCLVAWLATDTTYVGDIQVDHRRGRSRRSRVNLSQSQRDLYTYKMIDPHLQHF